MSETPEYTPITTPEEALRIGKRHLTFSHAVAMHPMSGSTLLTPRDGQMQMFIVQPDGSKRQCYDLDELLTAQKRYLNEGPYIP